MPKFIISLYIGGHDTNLSVYNGDEIITFECERIFGNRYFSLEYLTPSEQKGIFNYIKNILKKKGIDPPSYDVGITDWESEMGNEDILSIFKEVFPINEFYPMPHHMAHSAGAFYSSGFDQALVLSHDGGGDDGTWCAFNLTKPVSIFEYIEHQISQNPFSTKYSCIGRCIEEIRPAPHSALRQRLQPNAHISAPNNLAHPRLNSLDQSVAGKLMGLAAYGSFNKELFDKCIDYFSVTQKEEEHPCTPYVPKFWKHFYQIMGEGVKGREAYDLAFNAQRAFEEYFLQLFSTIFDPYKHKNVCLTGGGALNVVLNERLSKDYPAVNFFIPCSPSDSGLSYGMIAHHLLVTGQTPSTIADPMYSGFPVLDKESLPYILSQRAWQKVTPALLAAELERGKIIGVCRGDSETGPRALGNRSILADPRNPKAKDALNSKVKFREWYRPFAPICPVEKADTFFETSPNASYKYMSFSPPVRSEYQKKLPAITHVDGSSRLQTISASQNSFIYEVLEEFEKLTNIPILINTSFNTKGRAILTRYLTAIQILDSTELDAVVLEDFYIAK